MFVYIFTNFFQLNNFPVVHKSEKRTKAISFHLGSRLVNNIPVSELAHSILESAEPVDIYLFLFNN